MKSAQLLDFKLDKFKESWWATTPLTYDAQNKINQSYHEFELFWNSVWALHSSISPNPSKSLLNTQYDFYYDCILRHPESHIAFSQIEEGGFVTSWSYKKLHRCINYQLKKWLKQPPKPQTFAAIIISPGIEFVIALMAALRLGLIICCLSPQSLCLSPSHLSSLLNKLQLDLIISKKPLEHITTPTLLIEDLRESDEDPLIDSYLYPAEQTLQFSLALHRKEPYIFLPLDAHTTYLQALRDGLLALNLKPETPWITPFACPLLHEPWQTLASLLCGAHLMHVTDETLINDPLILKDKKPHHVHFSRQLLNLWTKDPGCPSKSLKSFSISPTDLRFPFWKSLIQINDLEKIPSFQALIDNSLGGITLLSKPTTHCPDLYLKPSFGTPWQFKNFNKSPIGSLSQTLLSPPNIQKESNYLLSQINDDFLLVSTDKPAKEGITLPLNHLEQTLSSLPFVKSCLIYPTSKPHDSTNSHLTYLIFVDPAKNDISETTKQSWSQQIHSLITEHIGSIFTPDHIEYFFLIPKMTGSLPDRTWCLNQYSSGLLSKKNKTQVYQLLSILKKLIQDALSS